ncbi:MAG: efflux RND transporter permease subunit [Candidatus Glassbacteria bacterium]|nr:efflux RND transporter permease subunit [Candidatus Glassbacteria bacterium]
MFSRLINLSLKYRLVVVVAALFFLISGVITAIRLPIDVFPDLTAPTVTVLTEAHGMASEEVEILVTFPIETAVNGATGIRRVRSVSAAGISIVWVEFDWGTDIFIARQIVTEKLQIAQRSLPPMVDPPVLAPISSIMGEIMLVSLTADSSSSQNEQVSEMQLREIADWTIRRRLLAVPGVSQVVPMGGEVKEYQVRVRPDRLAAYDVTLKEVYDAAAECNVSFSGGRFMDAGQEYLIRGLGRVNSLEEISHSVVAVRGGQPVLIRDVAEVRIGPAVKFGDAAVNTRPAVIVMVQKQPDVNTLALTEDIENALADIVRTLPAGITVDTSIYRQADFITVAVSNVMSALRDGAILVVIVLLLFLGNIRTTVISVVAIPLSIVAAIFSFKLFGVTINTMTLGGLGIAIGALVDDAIIYVENVFRRIKENHHRPPAEKRPVQEVIAGASTEIMAPMINATLIIIIVFVPLFFLSGIEGRLLQPMGFAYITSIFASLLVALTVTPALSSYLLPESKALRTEGDSWLVSRLKQVYRKVLDVTLRYPRAVIAASTVALAISLAVVPTLGRSFLPEFNEGSLTLSVATMPGTSLDESNGIGRLVERILLRHPEVISTARRTGRAELDEHAQGVNGAEIDVDIELNGADKDEFLERLRNSLATVPGTSITIGQPIGHRIDHMLSGTRANIAVKIFGTDLYRLRSLAQNVQAQMEGVEGLVDLAVEQQVDVPQVRIRPDRNRLAAYGISVRELAEMVDIALAGEEATQVMEQQRSFSLNVRYDSSSWGSLEKVRTAMFDTPMGAKVPLSGLADVYYERGPNSISRENVQRKIVVQANVTGGDLRGVVEEIRERVDRNVELPVGYHVEYGGQFESEQQATRTISLLSLLVMAGIFLILYIEFGTMRPALFILANLPLALIGGIWAVYFSSGVISIASLVGFITLFGIATRNGILMVSHYQHLLGEGLEFGEAIVRGSLERLNPILMTALTAALALVPLALGGGEPGKEIETPMAIVILGGLLSSTALNMIVIPSLFSVFGRKEAGND